MRKKTLVAYFSASGTTARAAKALAEAVGADLHEIVPERLYSTADLNWNDRSSRSSMEMNDAAARPEIKSKVAGMDDYEVVFVGFPIWWYVAPRIIETFLESYDFSGKTVVPFATSGGSDMGGTEAILKKRCSAQTDWRPGKMLNGRQSDKALRSWADGLGL
ncbi:flavodoxin [Gordonibacter sp. 28C]|uniref:flavodoxin n=1 Tax=Gordonibacter sp. 28C TaxID=2078569 RepID=UPI000DF7E428|nr:flavodoxin [Gordonibacter sp. 28C]RDB64316.1 flavodoxin [Gordonibacter sp. 28C]